ncbi:alcohol dehydrogenase [Streptomyces sp. PRh5]|nr:alcohol dehydrogenase [Streptomyces sp. PRh5]
MAQWVLPRGQASGIGTLTRRVVPIPEPGPSQVRIKVHATSLNFRDILVADRMYPVPAGADLVPLSDGAGVIDAVGPGATPWSVGDRVVSVYFSGWGDGPPAPSMGLGLGSGSENGMLAEYVLLPADRVVRAPDSLSLTEAATLPCAALTAWSAVRGNRPYRARPLNAEDTVLVLGTSGVSLFALQLAKASGAQVWATSSSESKLERLRQLGVAGTVNYRTTPRWGEQIFARTGGAQLVVNAAGSGSMDQAIAAVAFDGDIAFMGLFDQAGAVPDLMTLMGKAASIRGVAVGSRAAFRDLADTIDEYAIEPIIDRVVPFDEAPEAYRVQSSSTQFGKVVIEMVAAT